MFRCLDTTRHTFTNSKSWQVALVVTPLFSLLLFLVLGLLLLPPQHVHTLVDFTPLACSCFYQLASM
jgi:hypothetical protein